MLLKPADKLIEELVEKPFTWKGFFRRNITGILTTIIFHLLILNILLGIRIRSFSGMDEQGIVLDFTYKEVEEDKVLLSPEELARIELYERFLEKSLRAGNQAVNISAQLEEQISTSNFVEQVIQELEEQRSEEERDKLKSMEERLSAREELDETESFKLQEDMNFQGPTRITYEFFSEPFNRYTVYLPVPIYKCQGDGTVEVDIQVDRSGKVLSAKPIIVGSPADGQCLADAAVRYALLARFSKNPDAPPSHRGKITYSFVAQ